MAVADNAHIKAVLNFTPITGGLNQNVLHFRTAQAFADINLIAKTIHEEFAQRYMIQCGAGGFLTSTYVKNLDQPDDPPGAWALAYGGGASNPMPSNCTVKALLYPTGWGPRHRGEMFIFGASKDWLTNGLVNNAGINAVGAFLGAVSNLFVTAHPHGLIWCVRVRRRQPGITFAEISSLDVSNIWSTQRNRRLGTGV